MSYIYFPLFAHLPQPVNGNFSHLPYKEGVPKCIQLTSFIGQLLLVNSYCSTFVGQKKFTLSHYKYSKSKLPVDRDWAKFHLYRITKDYGESGGGGRKLLHGFL